jgi:hypothetical protein
VGRVRQLARGPVTLLRANAAAWNAGLDVTTLIAEIGSLNTEPDGFCWKLLVESDVETGSPVDARADDYGGIPTQGSRTARWEQQFPGSGRPGQLRSHGDLPVAVRPKVIWRLWLAGMPAVSRIAHGSAGVQGCHRPGAGAWLSLLAA